MNHLGLPDCRRTSLLSDRLLRSLMVLWLVVVIAGTASLYRYSLIAGSAAAAETHWPARIGLPKATGRDTLVMVVHPDCPCSRASMSELAALAANCENELSIDILFAQPPGLDEKIESTELWQSAMQIECANLIIDKDGLLARKLGATTSGNVFLYDTSGTLRFSGGITDSRGHAGNNAGRSAIEAIVRKQAPGVTSTPVFGCAL